MNTEVLERDEVTFNWLYDHHKLKKVKFSRSAQIWQRSEEKTKQKKVELNQAIS